MQNVGKALLYWIPTAIIVLVAVGGGFADAIREPSALALFRHLGYPDYFATLLGVAKILGGLALVVPIPWTLREWAYAGLSFDVLSASISSFAVHDPLFNVVAPLLFLALTLLSFVMWRRRIALAFA